ncbi:MAG: hypothetical protein CVV05_19790 [Gammaproteobacteria bacterium HGW-Gammaproteobacteria-1]|jgi:hypothetical protein|nr:MAG: hypothetical protein CVV05_19790 [Gammaproteobacteria bacterium HGW-Gammaproteobacteria-1]
MKWFFAGLVLANLALLGWNWSQGDVVASPFPETAAPRRGGDGGLTLLQELDSRPATRAESAPPSAPPQEAAAVDVAVRPPQAGNAAPEVAVEMPSSERGAAPEVTATCYRLAGFESPEAVAGAVRALARGGADIRGQGEVAGETKRYWVMLSPTTTAAKAEPTLERLKRAGIKDFYLIRSGDNRNAISLGVYSSEDSAKRRLRQIRDLNLNARVEEITLPAKRWWLEFGWPDDRKATSWRGLLAKDVRDIRSQACH